VYEMDIVGDAESVLEASCCVGEIDFVWSLLDDVVEGEPD
jgi:hypothetical protein